MRGDMLWPATRWIMGHWLTVRRRGEIRKLTAFVDANG
jgi:hypothetical protein